MYKVLLVLHATGHPNIVVAVATEQFSFDDKDAADTCFKNLEAQSFGIFTKKVVKLYA